MDTKGVLCLIFTTCWFVEVSFVTGRTRALGYDDDKAVQEMISGRKREKIKK